MEDRFSTYHRACKARVRETGQEIVIIDMRSVSEGDKVYLKAEESWGLQIPDNAKESGTWFRLDEIEIEE